MSLEKKAFNRRRSYDFVIVRNEPIRPFRYRARPTIATRIHPGPPYAIHQPRCIDFQTCPRLWHKQVHLLCNTTTCSTRLTRHIVFVITNPSFLPPLVPPPRRLDKACPPRAPLVGIEPELVDEATAVQAAELGGNKVEILGLEAEGLDLGDCLDGAGGEGEDVSVAVVEGPGEELLSAEVAGPNRGVVEEAGEAAVGGGGVEVATDDEEHLIDGVAFEEEEGGFGAEGGFQALAYRVQHSGVHLVQEGVLW